MAKSKNYERMSIEELERELEKAVELREQYREMSRVHQAKLVAHAENERRAAGPSDIPPQVIGA